VRYRPFLCEVNLDQSAVPPVRNRFSTSSYMAFARLHFEFDPAKAAGNLKKYRISFDKAVTVFNDPLSSTLPDDQHCEVEDLFIIVGRSSRQVGGPDLK
jgi:hypothetical protein